MKTIRYLWQNKILFLLLFFYYINILAISLLNGNYVCFKKICGIGIANVLFHDPIWHLALATTAFKTIPFQMPIFSGIPLQGYHFLYDFIVFLFSKIGLSPMFVYWKIMPQLFFIIFVFLTISYALKINKSLWFVFSYVFFLFFAGTLSFIPLFMHTGKLLGATDLFLQLNTVILAPNVAFSFIIFLAVLLLISQKKIKLRDFIILAICLFLQMGMKFYAGITLALFLGLYNLFYLFKKNLLKEFFLASFSYGIAFVLAVLFFYNPFSVLKGGSIFIFSPFTLIHPLIEAPDLYYFKSLVLARYFLLAHPTFSLRLVAIELFTLIIFFFHYFGVLNIGFVYVFIRIIQKKITKLESIFFFCFIFTVAMVVFFIQKGYYNDPFQFLYYGMFFLVYFSAQTVLILAKKSRLLAFLLFVFIILLSIPNNLTDMLMPYGKQRIISSYELQALAFLKKQNTGAIATDRIADSSYISVFTEKPVYIADTIQLEITAINYQSRKKQIENIGTTDLSQLPVQYFYLLKDNAGYQKLALRLKAAKFSRIYENRLTAVYKKDQR